MQSSTDRRRFLGILTAAVASLLVPGHGQAGPEEDRMEGKGRRRKHRDEEYLPPRELNPFISLSLVLGCVTDRSVTVNALAREPMEGYFEYGLAPGRYTHKTSQIALPAGKPVSTFLTGLTPNTAYFYRPQFRAVRETSYQARPECRFHTQREPGGTFTFCVQGDSHPERPQMSDPNLYARTLLAASAGNPDFYLCMGDDFSVEKLETITAETVAQPYTLQRPFLGAVARSAPLFLVNGNHEQASLFNFNQSDERRQVAILAQNARNLHFPQPAPDGFYTGDTARTEGIGPLRDYYAWTWGDALFVVLDCYWHSPSLVDAGFHGPPGGPEGEAHGGHKNRDWWSITLGNEQYHWLEQTLQQSKSKYKFVFAHHVLGTGRGGVEEAGLYEWGGRSKRGDWEFDRMRPGWRLPVHALMAKYGVSIFFQGHDHLFARQECDGIVYQEVPMPADPFYLTRNDDRYLSGVKLPNSGFLRVTVAPEKVTVDYVRSYLPADETPARKTGEIAHSYTIKPKITHA